MTCEGKTTPRLSASLPESLPGRQTPSTLLSSQVIIDSMPSCLGKLQPWMQGLIAVAVFLVLVAIAFAVNHFWCQEEPEPGNMVMTVGNKADGILVGTDGRYSSMVASFRSSEHKNAYENVLEEEGRVRSTPM
ncbi:PDZK1-interacting protein 1 [Sciurus carolinensis]|uniref:PDZK1-interacting protein 1 n=1 Tax=Sciurus carolinensis TaxID=30640 RepID=A0AA41T8E2_SCICA|nr:PDZK1-interacting protein 1 [Sciurus carolinensis]